MNEKTYQTDFGEIHYWINHNPQNNVELIFLPGLTADHKLFNKQIEYFENKYPVFVWDAPGHNNVATSDYGRKLMYDIMMTYDGDKERYSQLVGHGYKIIANAIEANKHYEI